MTTWYKKAQVQKFYGYKIVATADGGKTFYSIYDKSRINTMIGAVESRGGQGLFLGTSAQFCLDYYAGGTDDQDALLTYQADATDIIKGDITSPNGEVQVRKATLVKVELLPKTE